MFLKLIFGIYPIAFNCTRVSAHLSTHPFTLRRTAAVLAHTFFFRSSNYCFIPPRILPSALAYNSYFIARKRKGKIRVKRSTTTRQAYTYSRCTYEEKRFSFIYPLCVNGTPNTSRVHCILLLSMAKKTSLLHDQ